MSWYEQIVTRHVNKYIFIQKSIHKFRTFFNQYFHIYMIEEQQPGELKYN